MACATTPGLAGLVVAGDAEDIARFREAAAGGRDLLEPVEAQELGRALQGIGLLQVRIVA